MAKKKSKNPHVTRRTSDKRSGNPARRAAVATDNRRDVIQPSRFRDWIAGARPRTLPLAIAPVLVGTGLAHQANFHWKLALLCLVVALALQIGVNYANDYSDGIRGTDAYRVGPARLTGGGRAKPRTVLIVALIFFAAAAAAGLAITIRTENWWFLAVGAVAILAAWFYTGGKRPYGYAGLGEVMVFIFFGLVATLGTQYVLAGLVSLEGWFSAAAVGLIACAVLMVNNIRDIDTDHKAGKKTLAVRIGVIPSRILFCLFMLAPYWLLAFIATFYPQAWFVFFVLLVSLPACLIVVAAKSAGEYITALKLSTLASFLFGLGLGLALFA